MAVYIVLPEPAASRSGFLRKDRVMPALNQTHHDIDRIVRLPELRTIASISRSNIYAQVKAGTFPAPVSLGGRAVGWLLSDVRLWLAERAAARKEAA
jgi:prophage regulatory protein